MSMIDQIIDFNKSNEVYCLYIRIFSLVLMLMQW